MQTPPASTETSWVCVPRVGLSMSQVGYPVCTRACRSHLCTGRSAIAKWILGSRHRSHRSVSDYSDPPFIGRWGFSSGIPFVCYDITTLPADAPPPPSEPTNHGNSRQAVVLRMRYKFGPNAVSLHFFSSFRRENIYTILSSFSLGVSYAFIHVFQVSKQGRVMSFSVLSSPRHGMCMLILLFFHFMADGRLDVRKGPCGYKKPIFYIIRYSGEPGWSPSRGHPFC